MAVVCVIIFGTFETKTSSNIPRKLTCSKVVLVLPLLIFQSLYISKLKKCLKLFSWLTKIDAEFAVCYGIIYKNDAPLIEILDSAINRISSLLRDQLSLIIYPWLNNVEWILEKLYFVRETMTSLSQFDINMDLICQICRPPFIKF